MKTIQVSGGLMWDENRQKFIKIQPCTLELEHCLLSISRWEARWQIPFLKKEEKTAEQYLDYIRCMTMNNVPDNVYSGLTADQLEEITSYIKAPMSATWFNKRIYNNKKASNEEVTSELIYYWMTALNIPFTPCETWHFQRLMNLITIANIKNQPPKKMSKKDILSQNASINAARRAALNQKR